MNKIPFNKVQIIEDLNNGKTIKQISLEYNCNKASLHRYLINEGIREKSDHGKHLGKLVSKKDEIILEYNNGLTVQELALLYNADRRSIERFLKGNNVILRHQYENRAGLLNDKDDEIIAMYNSGLSCTDIALKYNCSSESIKLTLKNNNIHRRNKSFARRKYQLDETFFDVINTEEKAYILGWLYTDGYNHLTTSTVQLQLNEQDISILEKILKILNYDRPLKYRTRKQQSGSQSKMVSLMICNKHISEKLEELGCGQAKSHTITFPTFIDEQLMPHFLRGCWDGDGCFGYYPESTTKWTATYAGQRQFFDGMVEYLNDNNISCCISGHSLRVSSKKNFITLYNLIYGNYTICLQRKKDKADLIMKHLSTINGWGK